MPSSASSAVSKKGQRINRIVATRHIRRMPGGSQSHLMLCNDGNLYVVKFCNNPQHYKVLANEMLVTRLAGHVGLPVPECAVVEVCEALVDSSLTIQLKGTTIPCDAGLHFGSRYAVDPLRGQVFDFFPSAMLNRVRNLETFAGMLAMDKWTGNADNRQAVFVRQSREKMYQSRFIDHGYCFNAGAWTFPDRALWGLFPDRAVYALVRGWESFEPWLSRIERFNEDVTWRFAEAIPVEWYSGDWYALESLMERLLNRRKVVRRLLIELRDAPHNLFPKWDSGG